MRLSVVFRRKEKGLLPEQNIKGRARHFFNLSAEIKHLIPAAEQLRFGESTLPAIKMRKERIHHFYFARDKGDLFIISTVPPTGPGGGIAVDTVNGHGAVQEADLPVEREPESNGIIRKAVGKGNVLKIRRIAHPLRPADNGTGVETEAHTADNGGKRDVPVPRFGEKKGVRPIPCTETIQGIVDTGRIVRMGIEKINLLLDT